MAKKLKRVLSSFAQVQLPLRHHGPGSVLRRKMSRSKPDQPPMRVSYLFLTAPLPLVGIAAIITTRFPWKRYQLSYLLYKEMPLGSSCQLSSICRISGQALPIVSTTDSRLPEQADR